MAGIAIFIFGLLANMFILYLFLIDKYFQKTSYRLMCVSVISDLISSTSSLAGYTQIADGNLDYDGGLLMCRTAIFFVLTSFGISMMNLGLIGIDRYYYITKPLSLYYRRYKRYILITSEAIIWTISITANIPVFIYVGVYRDDPSFCDLPIITSKISVYLVIHAIILFVIPTIIIITAYARIAAFQKSYKRPGNVNENRRREEQMKNKKFVRALILISSSYIIISWPFSATLIGMAITHQPIKLIRRKSLTHFLLIFFSLALTTSISVLNPFIYLKFDSNIKARALLLLKRFPSFGFHARHSRLMPVTSSGNTNVNSTSKP